MDETYRANLDFTIHNNRFLFDRVESKHGFRELDASLE
jgi:hypothetical protein